VDKHLSVVISNTFVNKVLTSMAYPYVVVDEHKAFDESQLTIANDEDFPPMATQLAQKDGGLLLDSIANAEVDPSAAINLATLESDLQKLAADVTASRELAQKHGANWEGPTDAEISSLSSRKDWDVAVHCAWLKIVLKHPPVPQIETPITKMKNIKVVVSATGELWVKHWWLKCTRQCHVGPIKFCCRWAKTYVWTRIATARVSHLDLLADAKVQFSVEGKTSVVGRPLFDKLRIDHDILREIQLEEIANWFIRKKDKKFLVLKPGDIEIEVDLDKGIYVPQNFELPPTKGGIAVDVELRRS
jgi:hypothetical protein